MTKLAKITLIILSAGIVACIAGVIMISAVTIQFEAVILTGLTFIFYLMIRGAAKKGEKLKPDNSAVILLIAGLTLLVTFLTPAGITSRMKWQYPFQQRYISRFRNVKPSEYFPARLGEVLGDYKFEYVPSVMQGIGHYSVTYRTTPEQAAACAAEYAPKARYTIPLKEYIENGGYTVEDFTPRENSYDDGTLDVYISEKMRGGSDFFDDTSSGGGSDSTQIYVLNAVLNWNHPHSTAVIVDTETGLVQFSQLG